MVSAGSVFLQTTLPRAYLATRSELRFFFLRSLRSFASAFEGA